MIDPGTVIQLGEEVDLVRKENADLREQVARLTAERDEADRRAGEAKRKLDGACDTIFRSDCWKRKAKEQWGVDVNVSFDVVWQEALQARLERDALKVDAERYRFLRNQQIAEYPAVFDSPGYDDTGWFPVDGEKLDAAIDASRRDTK